MAAQVVSVRGSSVVALMSIDIARSLGAELDQNPNMGETADKFELGEQRGNKGQMFAFLLFRTISLLVEQQQTSRLWSA